MLRWLRRFGWLFTAAGRAEVKALFFALQDPRATLAARAIALLALVYALWPFDLVPDVIPVLGWLDDLLIAPLLMWAARKFIPDDVMANAREAVRRRKSTRPG
ncbi:MAG: DUF1232 domain-containing protein [Betaproteobacteria bacterium]